LKLGKVVGEPTAGWIIYTGAMELIDGSSMRTPGTLIQGADGKNMENNPRPVDIAVTRPIGESYTGKDSQLDAAVKELLIEIDPKNEPSACLFANSRGLRSRRRVCQSQLHQVRYQIPMRDGKKLFTSVYVPKDDSEKWPMNVRPHALQRGALRHR